MVQIKRYRRPDYASLLWHLVLLAMRGTAKGRQVVSEAKNRAGMVELVDGPDSKSGSDRSVRSIPTARTIVPAL